jgi:hypothetical protein
MSTFAHHGLIYVPLGIKTGGYLLADISEVRGGVLGVRGRSLVVMGGDSLVRWSWSLQGFRERVLGM